MPLITSALFAPLSSRFSGRDGSLPTAAGQYKSSTQLPHARRSRSQANVTSRSLQAMGVGQGTAVLVAAAAVVVFTLPSTSSAAGLTAVEDDGGLPCFHACFDQCVPRDEFWFCQLTCYHRCAGGSHMDAVGPGHLGCERSCALSLCGRLRPGSKVMAACRDTCRKSYAVAACTSSAAAA
ncbi:unnamed protein product [Urochloa humidicola]